MKCKRCGDTAVVSLPSHTTGFCAPCFLEFFRRQVDRGIEGQKLLEPGERILVALSGGKDSLSLMLALSELGHDVTALHIDLGIPGSSDAARAAVERFCARHGFALIVRNMTEEGLPLPKVKERLHRPICSACGSIKRHYFNRVALEQGFAVLATGHNLDDETARLFSNTLRWDAAYLSVQGPRLESETGFARKIKPFWRLTEFEIANYALLRGIENHYAPCPYSAGASFTMYKRVWLDIEAAMPGRKLHFYQSFLERGKKAFAAAEAGRGETLRACAECGSPSSHEVCGVCRIRRALSG